MKKKEKTKVKHSHKKLCSRYSKEIRSGQKYVLLGTYRDSLVLEEEYYHFTCWEDYIRQKINERIEDLGKGTIVMMKNLLPHMADVFGHPFTHLGDGEDMGYSFVK